MASKSVSLKGTVVNTQLLAVMAVLLNWTRHDSFCYPRETSVSDKSVGQTIVSSPHRLSVGRSTPEMRYHGTYHLNLSNRHLTRVMALYIY